MIEQKHEGSFKKVADFIKVTSVIVTILLALLLLLVFLLFFTPAQNVSSNTTLKRGLYIKPDSNFAHLWTAPAEWRIMQLSPDQQQLVHYGKELIINTSKYLGPKGSVKHTSNGMNCQNCHLNAGTQPWGNNYFAVEATYPKFRERSGTMENQTKRVNDCFERSLNGRTLDSNSHEMQAILAYIKWLGTDVIYKKAPRGSGIFKLKIMKRASDPILGKVIYQQKCQNCHQNNGEGVFSLDGRGYIYPPLWGQYSYNTGAGLFRISNLAGYVKYNMPMGVTYEKTQLSDEQAWDVAAFINSRPRPIKDLHNDWPNIAGKPFDHPFGPYADTFPEKQHKYGPYKPIKDWKEKNKGLKMKNLLYSKL